MDNHMPPAGDMQHPHPPHEHHGPPPPMGGEGNVCRCGHHKAIPILAIIFGLEFFFAEIDVLAWTFVNVTWPILVILAGIVALAGRNCRCCEVAR